MFSQSYYQLSLYLASSTIDQALSYKRWSVSSFVFGRLPKFRWHNVDEYWQYLNDTAQHVLGNDILNFSSDASPPQQGIAHLTLGSHRH